MPELSKLKIDNPNPASLSVNLVPFVETNDGTRSQMASSQMKQALELIEPELPYICTGLEQELIEDAHGLYKKINYDGIVTFFNKNIIIIRKDSEKDEDKEDRLVFIDDKFKVFVNVGDRVTKGQVVAKKQNFVQFGRNLLTVVLPYFGLNYEDSIVISRECAEKLKHKEETEEIFTIEENEYLISLFEDEYYPILKVGQELKVGDDILRIKRTDDKYVENNLLEPKRIRIDQKCRVKSVEVYVHNWNKTNKEYSLFMQNIVKDHCEMLQQIKKVETDEFNKKMLTYFFGVQDIDKLKYKNKPVNLIIRYVFESEFATDFGDKLANRYGNKGLISKILDNPPKLKDGRPIDIIINPLGIISRMNVGQIFEMHLSECAYQIKQLYGKIPDEELKEKIIKCIEILDCTKDKWYTQQTRSNFKVCKVNPNRFKEIVDNFYFLVPPFESSKLENIEACMKFLNIQETQEIFEPKFNGFIKDIKGNDIKVGFGYMYWLKLVHLSKEKISARSIGKYTKKLLQPVSGGKKNKSGQRLGEMEVWNLISHDGIENLRECLGIKSDDIKNKVEVIKRIMEFNVAVKCENDISKITAIIITYLNAMGLDLKQLKKETVVDLAKEHSIPVKVLDTNIIPVKVIGGN